MKYWTHAVALTLVALAAQAESGMQARAATPMRDPYVPAAIKPATPAPATTGEALHAQVMAKLQRQFAAADVAQTGMLTAEQSKRGGMGFVAAHFGEIDRAGKGAVSFEQIKAYLQRR